MCFLGYKKIQILKVIVEDFPGELVSDLHPWGVCLLNKHT